MSKRSAIARKPRLEDAELFRRRTELASLRKTLASREADLDRLRAQLNSFEGRYIRQVGVLYIQLDEWEDRIAELTNPTLPPAFNPESASDPGPGPEPEPESDAATLDLKSLFREVAKRIHPDRAANAHDELHRNHLMSQANAAFNRADADLLQRMLNGYDPDTDSGDDLTPAAQLSRLAEQIAQANEDILTIDAEITALAASEMADLRRRTAEAHRQGRDLLAELAARVKGSIGIAMRRFELERGRILRKQPAFNPEPLLTAERAPARTVTSSGTFPGNTDHKD